MGGCFRFFTDNYTELSRLAGYSFSSESAPIYPITNAFQSRRSKVYRTGGHFEVVSGSNTIVFHDAPAGVDKTATVTVGHYASIALFSAAVDAAFEAAGSANYTVTQDSFGRFVITSDISGGATGFEIEWTSSTAMAALMGYSSATDDTGASTYTADLIRIHSSEYVTFDLGVAGKPNCAAIVTARNSSLPFSPNANIRLIGNHTNTFTSPIYSDPFEYDDEIFLKQATDEFSSTALRFWSFYFEDVDNPNLYLEIGHWMLGRHYSPTRGRAQFPFEIEAIDNSVTITSEGGATFSDQKEKTEQFNVSWTALTKSECQDVRDIFAQYGKSSAFFVSMDTNTAISDDPQRFAKLVKFASEPKFSLVSPNNFSMSISLKEEI